MLQCEHEMCRSSIQASNAGGEAHESEAEGNRVRSWSRWFQRYHHRVPLLIVVKILGSSIVATKNMGSVHDDRGI